MNLEELRYVEPSELDDETNQYDVRAHMPIPTIDHVYQMTGVDVSKKGDEVEAKATVKYITALTMNSIKALIPPYSRPTLEYLVAKYEPYRKGFIDTVCAVISTVRAKGLSELLESGDMSRGSLPKVVQATAEANGLLIQHYYMNVRSEWIRENY